MTRPASRMRVLLLSAVGTRVNPYLGLLHDGLVAAGADVRMSDGRASSEHPERSKTQSKGVAPFTDPRDGWQPDVVHLHWLDRFDLPLAFQWHGLPLLPKTLDHALRGAAVRTANSAPVYAARRGARLRRLFAALRAFQQRDGRVAYTVHNLDPHEETSPVDRWGSARLIALADVLHVHDESTASALAARYGRTRGVAVIPHGHYASIYPNTLSHAAARDRLSLPQDAFVYACVGLLRPYKGLEELIPAFRALSGDNLRLLLAGKPGTPAYAGTLAALAEGDTRIRLTPQFVPMDEVQAYYNAADICVLPYRQITTSGAALLAFSFGLPIVAPAIGAFPSLVTPQRGVLYDPAQPSGLVVALMAAQQRDWQPLRPDILSWVKQFDWGEIGARLLAAYAEGS